MKKNNDNDNNVLIIQDKRYNVKNTSKEYKCGEDNNDDLLYCIFYLSFVLHLLSCMIDTLIIKPPYKYGEDNDDDEMTH